MTDMGSTAEVGDAFNSGFPSLDMNFQSRRSSDNSVGCLAAHWQTTGVDGLLGPI